MPWVGFEPAISAGGRPKTYALDRAATGTGYKILLFFEMTALRCSHSFFFSYGAVTLAMYIPGVLGYNLSPNKYID